MFTPFFNPFSKYADRLEKKADRFLKKIPFLGQFDTQKKLLGLMQQNLVVLNLWLEKEFKGYKYLKKSNRKKMYANTQIILEKFEEFQKSFTVDNHKISLLLKNFGLSFSQEHFDRVVYLAKIMAFLKPGQFYTYLEGASFGKLLKNIDREKMIGDCNQIVTFYTFLYSLHFDVNDLQIKILPGHVCLHFQGVDLEATNGTFQKYQDFQHILPITELISTNLLDVSDFRDKQLQLEKRTILKGAQLAFHISSLREIVEKNLQIAYHNLALESAKEADFATAVFFLDKLKNMETQERRSEILELHKNIFHNATVYYSKQRNFQKAKFYADKLANVDLSSGHELKRYVQEQEGFYYFQNGNISQALAIFKSIGNEQMVKACYGEEFNRLQKKVAGLRTQAEARNHRTDYRRMLELANLMGDSTLAGNIHKILNSL